MSIPNIQDYNSKTEKGLIRIQKIDDENYAISTKIFSAEDGIELPNQVVGVTISEVDKAIIDAQDKVDELKAFKASLVKAV